MPEEAARPHVWVPGRFGCVIELPWVDPALFKIMTGESMNRDVNLAEWLHGIGFHPASTEAKQLGHEAARQQVAWLGQLLHDLLPAGRDKSLVFTHLEDVLMRANRALALGGGPNPAMDTDSLRRLTVAGPLPQDPRVEAYKAEQRGEAADTGEHLLTGALNDAEDTVTVTEVVEMVGSAGEPWALNAQAITGRVTLGVVCHDPENIAEVCREYLAGRDADPTGPFKGFYVQFDTTEQLNEALSLIAGTGARAFGPEERLPL